jgi:hypothetical protein
LAQREQLRSLLQPPMIEFDETVIKFPGGASTDVIPNLQHPDNPVALLKQQLMERKEPHSGGGMD